MRISPTPGRFALVCPNYFPLTCGVGDHSMRLGVELLRQGAAVKVFTHAPAAPNPDGPSVDVYGANGVTPLAVVDDLRTAIARFQPTDLFVQYTPRMLGASRFGSLAVPALLAPFRGRVRITAIFHEMNFPWSWRPDLALGGMIQRVQFWSTVGAADRIFVSTSGRKRVLQTMMTRCGLTAPVDTLFVGENAKPVARRLTPNRRIGLFSTMGPNRRFDLTVDAFSAIRKHHPNAELVFIGDLGNIGSPAVRRLKDQISRSPDAAAIRLTGRVSLARAAEEVAALDVYLFADRAGVSTRSGTLPVAFGTGVPVVGIRGPETDDELFVDGENLVYVNELTASTLADATLRLLGSSDFAERIGSGGKTLYDRYLSWPAITARLLAA